MRRRDGDVRFIDRGGLGRVLEDLRHRGYELVGPTVRDGAIVLDRIEGLDDLPKGVGEIQERGRYRLADRGDERLFGFAQGPDSAKRFLFPARELLATVHRDGGRLSVDPAGLDEVRYAFVGLRPCDLQAVAVQDRVLHGWDARYAARRDGAFYLAVNCSDPAPTCFCDSMGGGPRCTHGFDLAITELAGGFLVEVGTSEGGEVIGAPGIDARPATEAEEAEAEAIRRHAQEAMGREVETSGLRELLYRNREHPQWDRVAQVCLACGNCTSVCPTCFCHDVVDGVDVTGSEATRAREWASCFGVEFSHMAGHDVRTSTRSRYRQWLTHKFATWTDQFGMLGCVGCGRCITWCPVGIDVTEQLALIGASDGAGGGET